MYPFASDLYAARNQWYVASYSRDVGRKPRELWILDEPVVLYRKEDGSVVALEGRCAHRHFPLGQGEVIGDTIRCPYHGISYGVDGQSVDVPSHGKPAANCKIRSYPTVELWEWIWIWTGDPELADAALIPDHFDMGLTDREFVTTIVCHHQLEARYQIVHDNLLDLTHVAYLHERTIGAGNQGAATSDYPRSEGPNWLRSDRLLRRTLIPPHYGALMGAQGECDRYMPIIFMMPGLHVGMDDFRVPSDDPERLGASLGKLLVYHAVTPARRNSAHYFAAAARNFGMDTDEALMSAAFNTVIDEDVYGLESVERLLRDLNDNVPAEYSARSDTQQLLMRRKLEALVRADAEGALPQMPLKFSLKTLGD